MSHDGLITLNFSRQKIPYSIFFWIGSIRMESIENAINGDMKMVIIIFTIAFLFDHFFLVHIATSSDFHGNKCERSDSKVLATFPLLCFKFILMKIVSHKCSTSNIRICCVVYHKFLRVTF